MCVTLIVVVFLESYTVLYGKLHIVVHDDICWYLGPTVSLFAYAHCRDWQDTICIFASKG